MSIILFFTPPALLPFESIFINWQILLIELLGIAILTCIVLLITYNNKWGSPGRRSPKTFVWNVNGVASQRAVAQIKFFNKSNCSQ